MCAVCIWEWRSLEWGRHFFPSQEHFQRSRKLYIGITKHTVLLEFYDIVIQHLERLSFGCGEEGMRILSEAPFHPVLLRFTLWVRHNFYSHKVWFMHYQLSMSVDSRHKTFWGVWAFFAPLSSLRCLMEGSHLAPQGYQWGGRERGGPERHSWMGCDCGLVMVFEKLIIFVFHWRGKLMESRWLALGKILLGRTCLKQQRVLW